MINSKKLIVGILSVSTAFIFACENKTGENKAEEKAKTEIVEKQEKKETKTLSCTLDNELRKNIENAVKKVFKGDISVKDIRNSSIPEMVEVSIETPNGKKAKVLFDCDGEYMMFGKVISITPPPAEEKTEEEGSGCLASGVSKSQIKSALSSLFGTDINIVEVNDTPISSIYEVIVRDPSGKTGILYMDCDLKHLILGSLLDIEGGKNLTAEKQKELAKNYYEQKEKELIAKLGEKKFKELKKVLNNFVYQLEIIDLNNVNIPKEGVIVYGNPNAKYTIYIISDPQCPFCAKLHDTIKKIITKRKDVKFEIFMFPLSFHQYAKGISENILCQETNEKRKEILDKSFEAVKNRNSEQLNKLQGACPTGSQTLAKHQQFAKDVNLRGTPLIIFPNGVAISGAVSEDILNKMINILSK